MLLPSAQSSATCLTFGQNICVRRLFCTILSVLAFKETSKFVKQIYSKRVQLLTSTSLILKKKTKQQKSYMKQSKNHPKTKEKLLTKRQVHSITLQGLNCPPLRGSQHLYPSINHHCRQQALQASPQTMISLPNPWNTSAIATYKPQTTSGGNQGKAISPDWLTSGDGKYCSHVHRETRSIRYTAI